jgi:hypothetical protein
MEPGAADNMPCVGEVSAAMDLSSLIQSPLCSPESVDSVQCSIGLLDHKKSPPKRAFFIAGR